MNKTIAMVIVSIIVAVFMSTGTCYSLTIIDIDAEVSGWVLHNGETNGRDASTTNFLTGTTETGGLQRSNFFVFNLRWYKGYI